MADPVRQSVHYWLIGFFLAGNLLLPAVLWRWVDGLVEMLGFAATGVLTAEPLLLGLWLGLARPSIAKRLVVSVGLSFAAASAYVLGILLVDRLGPEICALLMSTGVGATVLAGGLYRSQRYLCGVLEHESPQSPQPAALESQATDSPPTDSPAADELQFGVGYLIVMTSALALMISVLRWISSLSRDPSWHEIFIMGWTFFFYSGLAVLLSAVSVLAQHPRRWLRGLSVAYAFFAPLLMMPVINTWGLSSTDYPPLLNLYAYTLSLMLTAVAVACIARSQGYRLRHGRL
jgi:hypothetical protein